MPRGMSWHHTAIQTHESIWLTVYKSQSTRLGSENTINKYSTMKFTSLTTIVISAAAMAGIAIASEDLVITPMNLPCSPDSEHSCGLYADLRPRTYGYPQIQCNARRASKVGTTTTISGFSADLEALSYHTHHAPVKIAVSWLLMGMTSHVKHEWAYLSLLPFESEC